MRIKNPERLKRSRLFYLILTVIFLSVGGFLFISLKNLILPIIVGALLAYIFMPLLNYLTRKKIPKSISLVLIFGGVLLSIFVIGRQVLSFIPNAEEKLELRVRLQYRVNGIYLDYMDRKDFSSKGNFLYELIGEELNPVIISVNRFFNLNEDEKRQLFEYVSKTQEENPSRLKVLEYLNIIEKWNVIETAESQRPSAGKEEESFTPKSSIIGTFFHTLSNWIIMPFVFLFLLIDDGGIKKYLVALIPNRYFEMALTTLENVDRAIGKYLRGTLVQCSLVGLTLMIGLLLCGFDVRAAALIGIAAGVSNAIPFVGPLIGLAVGIVYAIILEDINPILPFLPENNAIIGVLFSVGLAQGMDNLVYQPFVLGKAVNLHPLVVVVGITGGSIIFGIAGMLFAVPAIVIFNVVVSTVHRQLKDYYLIY